MSQRKVINVGFYCTGVYFNQKGGANHKLCTSLLCRCWCVLNFKWTRLSISSLVASSIWRTYWYSAIKMTKALSPTIYALKMHSYFTHPLTLKYSIHMPIARNFLQNKQKQIKAIDKIRLIAVTILLYSLAIMLFSYKVQSSTTIFSSPFHTPFFVH